MPTTPDRPVHPPSAHLRLARVEAIDIGSLDWLTDEERRRFDGMASAERRDSFLAGHRLARELGAEWHGVAFTRVSVGRLVDGRPCLRVDGSASPLSISLSHSGGWILAGIAEAPIGVDVEVPRRARDTLALARHVFAPEEVERLQLLPAASRLGAFHETWALKEARGKQGGAGLLPSRSRRCCAHPATDTPMQALSWRLGDDGAVAIALDGCEGLRLDDAGVLSTRKSWRFADATQAAGMHRLEDR